MFSVRVKMSTPMSSRVNLLVIVIFLVSVLSASVDCVTAVIMAPVRTGTTEAALIIVPGASISGEAYRPLATRVQANCPLSLWVVLLEGFILNTPNPVELPGAVAAAIASLQQKGMTTDNYFLAGHSLGGVFVGAYGKSHASQLKGILLFASYLTRDVTLSSYPLPVLHLSGDLDGQTRITRIVDTFQQLEANLLTNSSSRYFTPVLIMPGVCHAQFASGHMPPEVAKNDLKPEATSELAYQMIANHTSAFFVSALAQQAQPKFVSQAKAHLDAAYNITKNIMQPLIEVKELDQNRENSDGWVIQAQRLLANLSTDVNVSNHILPETAFFTSEPSVRMNGSEVASVETVAHLAFSLNPMDISTVPSAPSQLAFKILTFDRRVVVPAAADDGRSEVSRKYAVFDGNITSCKFLNEAAMTLAQEGSSGTARRRYQSHGRPIFFTNDVIDSDDITWYASDLDLHEDAQGLHVTSRLFRTSLDMPSTSLEVSSMSSEVSSTSLNQLSSSLSSVGEFWCKGLSPFRAMEWMYVDSLRPTHA